MSDPIKISEKIKEELESQTLFKEYSRLKELYEKDETLLQMRKEIARAKKNNDEAKRNELIKQYNSHPIVNNYYIAKEELVSLLKEIKKILSD